MPHKVNTRASIPKYVSYLRTPGIKSKKQVEGKMGGGGESHKINNFRKNNIAVPSKLRRNYFQPRILS